MTKAAQLIFILALALTSARDLVCQVGCVEPGAPHAAASCHEAGSVADPSLRPLDDHCISPGNTPSTAAVKLTLGSPGGPLTADTAAWSQSWRPAPSALDYAHRNRPVSLQTQRTTVLRI